MAVAENSWQVLFNNKIKFAFSKRRIAYETERFIEYEGGGRYYKLNELNELTSKEWLRFQKSWWILNPRPREEEVLLHPAKFPEELAQGFIEFFTKRGQTVFDPMAGTGSTLIACFYSGRNGVGIELQSKYALIASKRLQNIAIQQIPIPQNEEAYEIFLKLIQGDSKEMDRMSLPQIDYVITSPPYWDMLLEKGFETQKERRKKNLDVHYSNSEKDLGNIHDYEKFLDLLEEIYRKVYIHLKYKGYLTIIVKNVKKKKIIYPLAWDIGKRLSKLFTLKDEKIWCQDNIKLAPYGYGHAWVSNTMHHYCLNFRKE